MEEFSRLVRNVVERWFAQNAAAAPAMAELEQFTARLGELIARRGLPRPLVGDERGSPGSMSETECAPLVAQVVDVAASPLLAEAARQLIKACFHPEFKTCRDSFRAVTVDWVCRRQQLARVRGRVSGTHCVDCPHWVALTPEQHEDFLAAHWRAGAADFRAHRGVYLPEDFRALRRWLHARARMQGPDYSQTKPEPCSRSPITL